jgi:hypothetical protein
MLEQQGARAAHAASASRRAGEAPRGITLRLATWNCARTSTATASAAVAALDASVAVLQEARDLGASTPGQLWSGPNPRNGLAAVAGRGFKLRIGPVRPEAPWSILPLRLESPIVVHFLLVWTRKEHEYIQGLDAALTAYAPFLRKAPSVVLGDFNANAIWDNPKRPTDFSRVAARLGRDFGLISAYHAWFDEPFGSESLATHYFWRRQSRPFHLDYCFIPAAWRPLLTSVAVLDAAPWAAASDHRPVVVDVALGTA